jgi:hypothetical protein
VRNGRCYRSRVLFAWSSLACDAWLTISRETAEVSEGNIELHRRAIDAYNAYDLEAFIPIADPSIEFHSLGAEIGGVYQGHDGLRKFLEDLDDAWGGRSSP